MYKWVQAWSGSFRLEFALRSSIRQTCTWISALQSQRALDPVTRYFPVHQWFKQSQAALGIVPVTVPVTVLVKVLVTVLLTFVSTVLVAVSRSQRRRL